MNLRLQNTSHMTHSTLSLDINTKKQAALSISCPFRHTTMVYCLIPHQRIAIEVCGHTFAHRSVAYIEE